MSESEQSGAGRREVAYRVFAAEYEDADCSYSESDEDRAPNYVVTPTGARVNRLFVVGVLTEVEQVSDDVLRGRVVDPTGAFVLYAGQYQPDEQAFLEGAEPPTFVAVTGKARTFQPEDSDQVFTSIRPESINEVTSETRDRWTVQAAEQTLDRIDHAATALSLGREGDQLRDALVERGVDEGLASGIPIALDHYGTTPTYLAALRDLALDAARTVAGERDEVPEMDVSPDEPGAKTAADLVDLESGVDVTETDEPDVTAESDATVETDVTSDDVGTSTEDVAQSTDREEVSPSTDSGEAPSVSDDEPADTRATSDVEESPDLEDFDPGEYELEEETRKEIEEEFGTEFQSGAEVDEPGEADIETPEIDGTSEPAGEQPADETVDEREMDETTVDERDTDETTTDAPGEDEETAVQRPDDLQEAVVGVMKELDDGGGADRETVLEEMEQRYGIDGDETEDAIQQALMDGQCYEPDDTTLKPI